MIKALQSELTINVVASIIVSLLFLAAGFAWGKYKERRRKFGRNLEEYDFYPFTVTRENFGEFSLKDFRLGMHYFLKNNDYTAARQLIFIGEQNNVRGQLEPAEQKVYAQLFEKYNGRKIADDTTEFLENYVRIVRLIGKSFPNTGIEILLHNLADPAQDRKSTRLNSSHSQISYAVFCLKKKKNNTYEPTRGVLLASTLS